MVVMKRRKMIMLKLARRPLKRGLLKTRKRSSPVLAHLQKRRKRARKALKKAETLKVAAEVVEVVIEVFPNRTRSLPLADHRQFPVVRFML